MVTYFSRCFNQSTLLKPPQTIGGGIFFDRDGTIIQERNYLKHIDEIKFLPGAIAGIKKLSSMHLPMYIFTNQAGVAHGFFNEETLNRIHLHLAAELRKLGITMRGILYCPHHPHGEIKSYRLDCPFRKPNPGLLQLASFIDYLDLSQSYVIGDKLIDILAGKNVGAKTALVLTGYGKTEANSISPEVSPDFIAPNLTVIADWIIHKERSKREVET